jgi:S1-C subfamily serine protease
LKSGDVIVALDGHTVAAADDLIRLLDASRIGRAVEVVVLRDGRRHLLTITPVERKS